MYRAEWQNAVYVIQWTLSYLTPLQFEKPLLFEHFAQSLDFQYIFVHGWQGNDNKHFPSLTYTPGPLLLPCSVWLGDFEEEWNMLICFLSFLQKQKQQQKKHPRRASIHPAAGDRRLFWILLVFLPRLSFPKGCIVALDATRNQPAFVCCLARDNDKCTPGPFARDLFGTGTTATMHSLPSVCLYTSQPTPETGEEDQYALLLVALAWKRGTAD